MEEPRIIDISTLHWSKAKDSKGYFVVAKVIGGNDNDLEQFTILTEDNDLQFMLRAYCTKNPGEDGVQIITKKQWTESDQPDEEEDLIDEWIRNGGYFDKKPAARSQRPPKKSAVKRRSKNQLSKGVGKKQKQDTQRKKNQIQIQQNQHCKDKKEHCRSKTV